MPSMVLTCSLTTRVVQVSHLIEHHRQLWALLSGALLHTLLSRNTKKMVLTTMEQIHSALHTRLSDTSHVGDVKVLLPAEWYIKNPPSHIAQLAISFNCICQMCCFKLESGTNVYVLSNEAVVHYEQNIFLSWMRTTVADIVARLKCGFDLPTTLLKPSGPLHPEKQQGNSDQASDAQSSSSFTELARGFPYKVHTTCGLCLHCMSDILHYSHKGRTRKLRSWR
jgi:hypothetical protein